MCDSGVNKPPRLALWLLERVVWSDDHEYAAGDFEEMYRASVRSEGRLRADVRCWFEVIRSLPGFINNSLYWGLAMFRNYFKVAVRNIARQKGFSFLNVTGLAVGVACCLVIALWVYSRLSIDRFHEAAGRIYQTLSQGQIRNNPANPAPLGPTLATEFPQVEYATRYEPLGNRLVTYGGETVYEPVCAVDSSFFQIFSFEVVRGRRADVFPDAHSVVVTETLARKYFGDADPIGQVLTLGADEPFTVSAVVADPPTSSSLRFRLLMPFSTRAEEIRRQSGRELGWGWYSPSTFVRLVEGADAAAFEDAIRDVMITHAEKEDATLSLLPFTRRYLFLTDGYSSIYLFSSVGLLILLIASINFVNLSTARSVRRAREVGFRRVVGAQRRNIVHQFVGETIIMAALAVVLAVSLVAVALPAVNAIAGTRLSLSLVPVVWLVPILAGLAVVLGILAGFYPAFLVSLYQPANIVAGQLSRGLPGSRLRRLLVVVQFTVSAVLIFATAVIHKQVDFSLNASLGYDCANLITVPLSGGTGQYYAVLHDQLARDSRILGVAASADIFPRMAWTSSSFKWTGKDPDIETQIGFNGVDYGFVETVGLTMASGRPFSESITSDQNAYLVNETMAEMMGGDSVLGQQLTFMGNSGEIVGVMRDFRYLPLTHPIGPMVFLIDRSRIWQMTIRLSSNDPSGALAFVRETWEKTVPTYPFQYRCVSDDVRDFYADAAGVGKLLGLFAGLALLVACLGILGLAACTAASRAREIAVRKVLGAGATATTMLMSHELVQCLLVANLAAWPIGYLLMEHWLSDYQSRIHIGVGLLALPLVITSLAAALAVSYQTWKTVRANPVGPLRSE